MTPTALIRNEPPSVMKSGVLSDFRLILSFDFAIIHLLASAYVISGKVQMNVCGKII